MRATQDLGRVDATVVVAQLLAAGLVGLILVPGLLSGPAAAAPPSGPNLTGAGWLAASVLIGAWLVALAPPCVRLVAGVLTASRRRVQIDAPTSPSPETSHLARWLVAFGDVLLVQAIVRPPLVVLLGEMLPQANAEALIAALTLVVLLLVLIGVHRAARPLVETTTRSTLDVFLASTASDVTVLATTQAGTTQRHSPRTNDVATRPAHLMEATVAAGTDAPTLRAAEGETVLAPTEETRPPIEATLPAQTQVQGGGR